MGSQGGNIFGADRLRDLNNPLTTIPYNPNPNYGTSIPGLTPLDSMGGGDPIRGGGGDPFPQTPGTTGEYNTPGVISGMVTGGNMAMAPGLISGLQRPQNRLTFGMPGMSRAKSVVNLPQYKPPTEAVTMPTTANPAPAPTNVPTTNPTVPGGKPGETLEMKRARIKKNRRAKGEIV